MTHLLLMGHAHCTILEKSNWLRASNDAKFGTPVSETRRNASDYTDIYSCNCQPWASVIASPTWKTFDPLLRLPHCWWSHSCSELWSLGITPWPLSCLALVTVEFTTPDAHNRTEFPEEGILLSSHIRVCIVLLTCFQDHLLCISVANATLFRLAERSNSVILVPTVEFFFLSAIKGHLRWWDWLPLSSAIVLEWFHHPKAFSYRIR